MFRRANLLVKPSVGGNTRVEGHGFVETYRQNSETMRKFRPEEDSLSLYIKEYKDTKKIFMILCTVFTSASACLCPLTLNLYMLGVFKVSPQMLLKALKGHFFYPAHKTYKTNCDLTCIPSQKSYTFSSRKILTAASFLIGGNSSVYAMKLKLKI